MAAAAFRLRQATQAEACDYFLKTTDYISRQRLPGMIHFPFLAMSLGTDLTFDDLSLEIGICNMGYHFDCTHSLYVA